MPISLLLQHLRSAKHLEYAHNDANFTSLDDIISRGTTLKDFVSSVRASAMKSPSTPLRYAKLV